MRGNEWSWWNNKRRITTTRSCSTNEHKKNWGIQIGVLRILWWKIEINMIFKLIHAMNPAPGAGKTVSSRVAKRLRSFIVWRLGDEWGVWLGKKRLKVHAFRGFQHDSYRCRFCCCCCCVVDADLRPWTASVGKCVRMESGILNCISIALSMEMVGLSSLSHLYIFSKRLPCHLLRNQTL